MAKLLGVVLMLAPGPGFAVDLASTLIAHLSVGGGHRRARGALVLLVAPPAGHAGERLTAAPPAVSGPAKIGARLGAVHKKAVPVESASALIDEKIKELVDWRGKTLAKVREIARQADPDIVEEWKWRGTIWSHGGIVCAGETYNNIVKMTFAKGAALKDPLGLFNPRLDGNVVRANDIHEGDKVDEAALKDLIRAAVALKLTPSLISERQPGCYFAKHEDRPSRRNQQTPPGLARGLSRFWPRSCPLTWRTIL